MAEEVFSRADLIFPKVPLINPKTGRRSDGRDFEEFRQIYAQSNIRDSATGSALLEFGQTKVLCFINGPKDLPKKSMEFSQIGVLNIEVQLMGDKVPEMDVILLKESLESVVQLDKFPKCQLDIYFTVLEDDGSYLATCITAAGIALLQSGVPIYDTPIGSCLMYNGDKIFLDPSKSELQNLDLTDPGKNSRGGGLITMGYMPLKDQVCLLTSEGRMDPSTLIICMDKLKAKCLDMMSFIREHCIEHLGKDSSEREDRME